jgi:hypothetical protein
LQSTGRRPPTPLPCRSGFPTPSTRRFIVAQPCVRQFIDRQKTKSPAVIPHCGYAHRSGLTIRYGVPLNGGGLFRLSLALSLPQNKERGNLPLKARRLPAGLTNNLKTKRSKAEKIKRQMSPPPHPARKERAWRSSHRRRQKRQKTQTVSPPHPKIRRYWLPLWSPF